MLFACKSSSDCAVGVCGGGGGVCDGGGVGAQCKWGGEGHGGFRMNKKWKLSKNSRDS